MVMGSSPFGPVHVVGLFDRLVVPCNLMSKSWEPSSFTEVPESPQTLPASSGSKTKECKWACLSEHLRGFTCGPILSKNLVSTGGGFGHRINICTL